MVYDYAREEYEAALEAEPLERPDPYEYMDLDEPAWNTARRAQGYGQDRAQLTLKPINFGYPNQTTTQMETWLLSPPHLPALLRLEYRHLRSEGCSRRAARWHVHRMIAMIANRGWSATSEEDPF